MSNVYVRNSCIKITNYHLKQAPKLESCFTIWEPLYHRYQPCGIYYDKEEQSLYVPRGIDIWYVKKQVGAKDSYTERPNPYKEIDHILMKAAPRDDRQVQALQFTCGIGQEYEDNFYLPQLSVNLNTGVGKTYVSIATIGYYKIKSMIITGSNTLLNQWKDKIKEYTNLTDKDILFISGSGMMNMILQGKSKLADNASIFLCTHGTLRSFGDEYGWDKLNEVFLNLGIGMKFFDEAHQNFDNMCKIDFFTNVFKTFYVTATPARSDFRENRVYQIAFKNVIIQFAPHKSRDDGAGSIDISFSGSGEGFYATNGQIIPIKWEKDETFGVNKFKTVDGEKLKLNPGKTWITVFPDTQKSDIVYQ